MAQIMRKVHISPETAWENLDLDAIACPVTTDGNPSDWRGELLSRLGVMIRPQLQGHLPLANGAAISIAASSAMEVKWVIAATDYDPALGAGRKEQFSRWIASILIICDVRGFDSVAIPMRSDSAALPLDAAIRLLHSEIVVHAPTQPEAITIVGPDWMDCSTHYIAAGLSSSAGDELENPPILLD